MCGEGELEAAAEGEGGYGGDGGDGEFGQFRKCAAEVGEEYGGSGRMPCQLGVLYMAKKRTTAGLTPRV